MLRQDMERAMKKNFPDFTGQKINMLTVVSGGETRSGRSAYMCVCECGSEIIVRTTDLSRASVKSCGCLARRKSSERASVRNKTHGMRNTKTYSIWQGMTARCLRKTHTSYKSYGARGVTVCDEWLSFEAFLSDMGECPSEGHSIDRIDNEKGYFKENCRWATTSDQANNRRSNTLIEYKGEVLTLSQWATRFGMTRWKISDRIKSGLPLEEVFINDCRNGHTY
jgi:hypothetical protein